MKLDQTTYDNSETDCCARLDSEAWDGRVFEWQDKPFLTDHIKKAFHVPLNFGMVMTRDHEAIEEAEAYPEEPLWLTDEVSPWRGDVYVAVDRDIPGQDITKMSGRFIAKVFEGPYRNMKDWIAQMNDHVAQQGYEAEKLLFYYPYCPDCAKAFGENEVVILAKVG